MVNNLLANADTGDEGSIPGLGRSLGGGNGNPLRILAGRPMDRGAWRATVPRVTEWDVTEQLRAHTRCYVSPTLNL